MDDYEFGGELKEMNEDKNVEAKENNIEEKKEKKRKKGKKKKIIEMDNINNESLKEPLNSDEDLK